MAYGNEDIRRHLRLGEDSGCEFKEIVFAGNRPREPRRDDWADEIAAFANAAGGMLLCSVTDEGEVREITREQMNELEIFVTNLCTDLIRPPIRASIFRTEAPDGTPLMVIEVPEGHAQHDSPGGAYVRVGSTKRRMSSEERLRLAQRRGQASFLWFDKQTVAGTGFGSLDEALWKPLLSAEGAAEPRVALEKMGLLAQDQNGTLRATVAGVLLCCSSPEEWLPNASIIATRYMGTDRSSDQLDSQEIKGPLDRQIREALYFTLRNMSVAALKVPARQDLPQYSDKAVFEALVNAVVHRDYSIRGSRIRLSMFDDRLEICSPGGLPNNLTVESMGERQSTRNEVLTSVLGRMNVGGIEAAGGRQYFLERRGDGVPIIRRATQELCGSPPGFRLVDDAELCVTIPAASTELRTANAVIFVHSYGEPLPDVDVLALFPNKTWKKGRTGLNGEAAIELHSIHLPMTVFAVRQEFAAKLEKSWIPEEGTLSLELTPLPGGGSLVFEEATGNIPGLSGRLNPIRDSLDRTYLYASNVSVNDGKQQPVHFILGEDLLLTDSYGKEISVRILDVLGRSALVEYGPSRYPESDKI